MADSIKKRGQKFLRKFSRFSLRASEEGKEHIKENLVKRFSHVERVRLLVLEWGLLVVALILFAFTQSAWFKASYSEEVFTSGGTYTEATIGDVNSMNPLFATTSSEKVLSRLMFATISTIDYSGHPGAGLARTITPSENGKIWKVKLKDNLKWSDGEPITNEDVIFTVGLIKNPAVNTIYTSNLSNVNVSENEEGEIVFELPTTYADFISALNIPVVPKHILENSDPKVLIENEFSMAPITSGAFTFNAIQPSSNEGEKVFYLSSNPYYYKGKTLLNSFVIHTYADEASIIDAINSGSVTATAEISDFSSSKISNKQFFRKDSSLNSGAFIFFNTSSARMKDEKLRAAIRRGIDIAKIRDGAPNTISLDYPLLSSQINVSSYPEIPSYSFEEAKAIVDELAGGETIHVNVATVNSGYLPNVTNIIAEELKMLGLEAEVTVYEENQDFITNIVSKRNYDILVYEVELGADPDLLPYYHSSQASNTGLNLSNYRNSLVDDLLLSARNTLDENLRIKKYETFLEYWVTNVPAIALYRPNLTYIYNKNTRTFNNDIRLVTALDRFTDITDWAVNKTVKNKTP